ncbi:MAG: M15 family metallopeptidase [Candidatus Cybelea sp.]
MVFQDDSSDGTSDDSTSNGGTSSDSTTNGSTSSDGTTNGGTSSDGSMDGGVSSDGGSSDSSVSEDASSDAGTTSSTTPVDYKATVPIPSGINSGLSFASQATMLTNLGNPGTPDPGCGPVSAALQPLMKTANVGPFQVTGLGPAVDALTRVFSAVQSAKPDLYAVLGTAGMLCVRYVRGSTTNFSNHAWGTAIDMTIGGVLTARGSTTVTQGLVDLAPFMAAESFFWGAGFSPTPDGMHFEASNELISQWKANGTIP